MSSETIEAVLKQRNATYGSFEEHAEITQALKKLVFKGDVSKYTPSQREALEMILHKVGRIANGDPNYKDSWVDIAGYAKLIYDTL